MPLKLVVYSRMTDVVVASPGLESASATLQGPVMLGLKNDILMFIHLFEARTANAISSFN